MRLSLSGGELDAQESIDLLVAAAEECSIEFVELWYPKNFSNDGRAVTSQKLDESGIQAICIATPTEMVRGDSTARDQDLLRESIQFAAEIGALYVNTYFGHLSQRDDDYAIDDYARAIEPCLRDAAQLGVYVCLENECDYFGRDPSGSDVTRRPETVVCLFEKVGSPFFKLTFDPANAYFAGNDPISFYHVVKEVVAYIHVKDGKRLGQYEKVSSGFHGCVDNGINYATCPFGKGDVPWEELLKVLECDGYNSFLTLEPHCYPSVRQETWRNTSSLLRKLLATK